MACYQMMGYYHWIRYHLVDILVIISEVDKVRIGDDNNLVSTIKEIVYSMSFDGELNPLGSVETGTPGQSRIEDSELI